MNVLSLLAFQQPGITIFGVKIYAYALIIVSGMAAAFVVISLLFKRRNMSTDLFLTYFCICLPVAILTTRLFYCITDGMPIKEWFSLQSIRQGGLSIIGGIIGGTASVAIVSWVKKVPFLRVGDCVVVGLLLAQSIGRWGNFANQEVYGAEVTNEALQFFPIAVYIEANRAYHYAFFFYESMVTLTAAILMFINAWKNGKKPNGVNTACYFIVYGLTRSIMEPLRAPAYILGDSVPWSLVLSLVMLAFGLAFLFVVLYRNKRNEGKLFGSLKADEYGITKFIGDTKKEKPVFSKWNMMCAVYPENYPAEDETETQAEEAEKTQTANEEEQTEQEK